MEERLGMLKSTNNQENIYKVNIDLKVHGEELKKVIPSLVHLVQNNELTLQELTEKQNLLSEAAQALQSQVGEIRPRVGLLSCLQMSLGREISGQAGEQPGQTGAREREKAQCGERDGDDEAGAEGPEGVPEGGGEEDQ